MARGLTSAQLRLAEPGKREQYSFQLRLPMPRHRTLEGFYDLLTELERRLGGTRRLADCDGRMTWPARGVYFFFEAGEVRTDSGNGPRVVRVGTHALWATSRTTLWKRLSQHRGQMTGGGNHRGSIFRLTVGSALKARSCTAEPTSWGFKGDPGAAAQKLGTNRSAIVSNEAELEAAVSRYVGAMPFLWLSVDGPGGSGNLRGYIERNAIALLSNYEGSALDPASRDWLGRHSDRELVCRSGLWNSNHVDETCDPAFLDNLRRLVEAV